MGSSFDIIDIHTHILPGLDDGARSIDESLRMCELYVAQGVATVVATPHTFDRRYRVTPEAVLCHVDDFSQACKQRGLNLGTLSGGDVRLQPRLLGSSRVDVTPTGRETKAPAKGEGSGRGFQSWILCLIKAVETSGHLRGVVDNSRSGTSVLER